MKLSVYISERLIIVLDSEIMRNMNPIFCANAGRMPKSGKKKAFKAS